MHRPNNIPETSKFLEGTGDSGWFHIEASDQADIYKISRYTVTGILECRNNFLLESSGFDIHKDFEFTYVSHCKKCTIIQYGIKYVLIHFS